MVPPFVTAHMFCASPDSWVSNTTTFLRGLRLCGKSRSEQGLSESKKKIGGKKHFSEITELKFGKKLPHILCILTLF